ncbi:MAG: hypothetical protein FK734_03170 [Asgard group archaeon]|nr:hypothetical protein [Asgard group archaeon]
MSPEADEAPIDHLKVNNEIKLEVIKKLVDKEAYNEKSAVEESELELEGEEKYAFKQLISDDVIEEVYLEDKVVYYVDEYYKPVRSYRKEVVMGLSIPLLIFLVLLMLGGLATIIYVFIDYITNII